MLAFPAKQERGCWLVATERVSGDVAMHTQVRADDEDVPELRRYRCAGRRETRRRLRSRRSRRSSAAALSQRPGRACAAPWRSGSRPPDPGRAGDCALATVRGLASTATPSKSEQLREAPGPCGTTTNRPPPLRPPSALRGIWPGMCEVQPGSQSRSDLRTRRGRGLGLHVWRILRRLVYRSRLGLLDPVTGVLERSTSGPWASARQVIGDAENGHQGVLGSAQGYLAHRTTRTCSPTARSGRGHHQLPDPVDQPRRSDRAGDRQHGELHARSAGRVE